MKFLKILSINFLVIISSINNLKSNTFHDNSTTKDRELLLTMRNSNCLSKEQKLSKAQDIIQPLLSQYSSQTKDNSGLTLLMLASALGDVNAVKEILKRHSIHTSSRIVYPEEAYDDFYDPDESPPTLITKKGNKLSENDILLSEHDSEQEAFSNIDWAIKKPLIEMDNTLIKERKPYIRAETIQGYTALSFAVVGGHYEIVKLLTSYTKHNTKDRIYRLMSYQIYDEERRMAFAKSRAFTLTYDFINKLDKSGWAAINYAVSFNSDCINEEKMKERVSILELLINLGAINNIVSVWEGDLDVIGLASKYGHYQLVHRILCLYLAKAQASSKLLHHFFGQYFKECIIKNVSILERTIEIKEENGETDLNKYKKTLHVLKTWKNLFL